ncbi:lethal (3) malignant brain tumor isoform X2 [Megalopta genalis]|uniref:lethal (3) malignant brain tumor isoform X2 n=1 Tax=Megalopta genalis TaxID=115081 RepID=UPI003FD295A9
MRMRTCNDTVSSHMMATDNFKTMEEEIVVDDVDENSSTETAQSDDPTTPIMPLLYIQQSKLRSAPPTTTNQTLVSSNATQLAAIINPVNNQIVAGQNKVFIQGPGQVTSSQNKQHIVIHRPINTVSTTATSQGQKHILLRKSNASTAQIVPLSSSQGNQTTAQAGKHTFAYLGTLIKPNKSRESVVIPAGALTTTQIAKPKLVIGPVISQLAQTSTSTTTGSQSQTPKHMANLLLPVSIPQQSGPTKSSMFNLKINNGQISTESKGTITVLRESKATNSATHPPPLHPIAKMSLLSANKGNNNSTDSIKITENPDSAVITPIPKKDDSVIPEKRKKTISNILRGSNEKRLKKQNLSKSPQDSMVEVTYALSSPESEQDKDKKVQNDDDITLIKVVPSEEKSVKLNTNVDDDIKIEIIKTRTSCVEPISDNKHDTKLINHDDMKDHLNTSHTNDSNFDAAKVLDWKDGVGTLPGSTLKFCMNEFGIMEVVDEDENNKQGKDGIGDKENVCLTQNSSKSSPLTVNNVNSEKKSDDRKTRIVSVDTMYHCEGCGCYGLAAEFETPISCSPSCSEIIEATKKQPPMRKEKDLKDLRAKRKRKRLLQEQQQSKEMEDKTDEKVQDKVKSETDEDTKDTIAGIDDESQGDSAEAKTGKVGFSWSKYLEHCKAKAAPVKLFKDPFPYSKNNFKVGMRLEGIDPEHPSRYCVLTVVEVVGYRIRLHFDGYPENYDFWVNADSSMDIFPVGWSEKNGHRLDPPKGYVASNFNWNAYLKICKTTAAPKTIFPNKSSVFPTGFRVGMKLEAVDRKHSSLVCVASIAGLMDSRILVHFDSWDEVYDYWADASSPYIHPVGWCHHNGHSLTPPNNYKDPKSFTWDAYLRETRSMVAPARAFKQRPPCGFKRGMKLEAVDKRVPQLIRVATVEDVKDHMLKIRFDGWPENHAYWVDDDSPDIHPMGWCMKTGHPLEPPLTPDNLNDRPECGTYGCRGIGHVKGPKYATHNSASGCPYSPQNLHKVRQLSDRLNLKHETCDFEDDVLDKPKTEKTDKIKMEKSEKPEKLLFADERLLKTEKDIKQEDGELSDKNDKSENSEKSSKSKHHHSDGQTDDDELLRKRKKRRQISEEPLYSLSNYGDSSLTTAPYAANMPDKQLRMELYQSVYNPGYNPLPDAPHIWAKHSNALNRVVARQNTNPRRWSNEEVIKFIQSMPNCKEIGNIFRKHNIDGEAFLMLTQEDLVSLLGLRLGPAIKLYNSIVLLRRRAS